MGGLHARVHAVHAGFLVSGWREIQPEKGAPGRVREGDQGVRDAEIATDMARLAPAAARRLSRVSAELTPVESLDTPALLIDMEALEHNIRTYAATMADRNCIWRPHCKAIRSPELAHMLVDAGAIGVTCAKISQAAALADGGITDILIANEIVAPAKVAALIDLAAKVDSLCVAVDDEGALRAIAAAAVAAGMHNLDVLVDVNVGMNRCGIHWENLEEIVRLSQLADSLPGVGFRGLMGYDGGEVATAASSAERLHAARNAVKAAGTTVKIISGAGSENYWVASALGEGDSVWEMQGGGGVLCCQKYYNTFNTADDAPSHKSVCQTLSFEHTRAGCQHNAFALYDASNQDGLQSIVF